MSEITKSEVKGFLNTIGINASLDNDFFADKQIIKDIYSDIADNNIEVRNIPALIQEISSRVLNEIDPERESDIYFYFNYLDSEFDGEDEEILEKADALWNKTAVYSA